MFFHALSIHVRCRNDDSVTIVTKCLTGAGRKEHVFRCLAYTVHVYCLTFTLFLQFATNVQFVWPGYHVIAVALRQGGLVLVTSVSLTPKSRVTECVVSRMQWTNLPSVLTYSALKVKFGRNFLMVEAWFERQIFRRWRAVHDGKTLVSI